MVRTSHPFYALDQAIQVLHFTLPDANGNTASLSTPPVAAAATTTNLSLD